MTYKRATAQLRAAGIEHLVIVKRYHGAAPEDPRLWRQRSICYPPWQQAVSAVLAGMRPEALDSVPG